jgi:pimeloyl-ACP methyl ester carboxylesterase
MLHYVRQGSGKTIVLIHGFLAGAKIFEELTSKLAAHFDVITIDLPGHGKSKIEVKAYTVEAYAEAIIEVLKHEKVEQAIWLGHSMGGYITLAAMGDELFPIPKAILLHSAINADTEEIKEKRTAQQIEIKKNGVDAFVKSVVPKFLAEKSPASLAEQARSIASEASIEGLVAALEAMKARPTRESFINETSTPVLIIEGAHDKVVPPINTNNEVVTKVVVDSGHLGMIEDVDGVFQAIYRFLENENA